MTSKTIIIGLVALAFVAGSIMTGTMVDAAKVKVDPLQVVLDAIAALQLSVDGIDTSGLATQDSVDDVDSDVADANAKLDTISDWVRCDTTPLNLIGVDLSGCNLSGRDLSGKDLTGADLSGADLTGVDFGSPIIGIETNAILLNADLTGATLGSFYIDTTFTVVDDDPWSVDNLCVDGFTDSAITILEDDADWQRGGPFVAPQTMGLFEGDSNVEPTVFTILCEES